MCLRCERRRGGFHLKPIRRSQNQVTDAGLRDARRKLGHDWESCVSSWHGDVELHVFIG